MNTPPIELHTVLTRWFTKYPVLTRQEWTVIHELVSPDSAERRVRPRRVGRPATATSPRPFTEDAPATASGPPRRRKPRKRKNANKAWTPREDAEVKALYRAGATSPTIATRVHRTPGAVRQRIFTQHWTRQAAPKKT